MDTFDSKQTSWEGLWYHPEYNGFSSAVINLAKLKGFKGNVRLYVRKNKFFNRGENGRPNYCKENNTCQSKKCATGGDGRVNIFDRLFCEPYKGERKEE